MSAPLIESLREVADRSPEVRAIFEGIPEKEGEAGPGAAAAGGERWALSRGPQAEAPLPTKSFVVLAGRQVSRMPRALFGMLVAALAIASVAFSEEPLEVGRYGCSGVLAALNAAQR